MPEDPAAWAVIAWAAVIASVSIYYVYSLLGDLREVSFGE